MATVSSNIPYIPGYGVSPTYLNISHTVGSWLLTKDHKRIAILYLISITFFFFIGGAAATLIRLNLLTPTGLIVDEATYNKLFTIHGIIMVWFFLIPSIPTTLGNFLIPLMIGAKDLAFPRINLLSWYLYIISGIFAFLMITLGGVDTGWTFYTPYSSAFSNTYVAMTVIAIFINGFSSILTGLNFIVTIHKMRCAGADLVSPAVVLLEPLCHEPDNGAGHAGLGHHSAASGNRACFPNRDFRPAPRRGSNPVPTYVLVLLPPRSLYHGVAWHGRGE